MKDRPRGAVETLKARALQAEAQVNTKEREINMWKKKHDKMGDALDKEGFKLVEE